uniref:Auxin-induced protein 5NG4 n=1 Tax=Aegilops tauschii TaxID=37682 RepID=M8BZ22_AEGTA
MRFHGPTYRRPRTVPERDYPAGVIVENSLRVWAISRWRGPRELIHFFLQAAYRHLAPGTPPMFHLHELYDGGVNGIVIGLYVTFTNPYDAYHLLGQVFWCGCEFIAFTTYNIFTNFHHIFPEPNGMHTLPYQMPENDDFFSSAVTPASPTVAPMELPDPGAPDPDGPDPNFSASNEPLQPTTSFCGQFNSTTSHGSYLPLNMGIGKLVFPVYRNIITLILLVPFAYFLEKKDRPKLTLNFVGFYLLGLDNTSPTFAPAIQNSVLAITFTMAAALRIEKVRLDQRDGVAKAPVLKKYPARLSVTSYTCFFGVIQFLVIAAFFERDADAWVFHSGSEIFTILYARYGNDYVGLCIYRELAADMANENGNAGFIASGVAFAVQICCIDRGGPVFVAVYQPVQTLVVAIMASITLGEKFYLGGIIGAAPIITGLYLVLWGKSEERSRNGKEAAAMAVASAAFSGGRGGGGGGAAHGQGGGGHGGGVRSFLWRRARGPERQAGLLHHPASPAAFLNYLRQRLKLSCLLSVLND